VAQREDGLIFMVMQLLKGRTLRELIQDLGAGGRLPVPWALQIGVGIAAGLEAIHEHAVHRDIKPENVHVADDGWTCLFDLGAGMFPKESRLTTDGYTLGTLNYMSPEQLFRPTTIDGRSDLFSLGTILYEVLSAMHPLAVDGPINDNKMELGNQVIFQAYKPLGEVAPHVPRYLCQIVDRLLAKDPDARYRSAGVVWDLLTAALDRYHLDHQAQPPASMELIGTLPRTATPLDPALTPSLPTSTNPFITLSLPELLRDQESRPSGPRRGASKAPASSVQVTEELPAFLPRPSAVLPFKARNAPIRGGPGRLGAEALVVAPRAPEPERAAPQAPELGSDQFARHAMLPSFDSMADAYASNFEEDALELEPDDDEGENEDENDGAAYARSDFANHVETPAPAIVQHRGVRAASFVDLGESAGSSGKDTLDAFEAPPRPRPHGDERPTMIHRATGVSRRAAIAVVVGTAAIVALGGLGAIRAMGLYSSPRPASSAADLAPSAPSPTPSTSAPPVSTPALSAVVPAPSASASSIPAPRLRPPPAPAKPSASPRRRPLPESGFVF
jgi:hypothetical protein